MPGSPGIALTPAASTPGPVLSALGLGRRLEAPAIDLPDAFLSGLAAGAVFSIERLRSGRYVATVRTGAEGEVDVTMGCRTRRLALADVCLLVAAGTEIDAVEIPRPGVWTWAWCTLERGGRRWTLLAHDYTGAAAALDEPVVFDAVLPPANRARRPGRAIERTSSPGTERAVASAAAWDYLRDPAARGGDTGPAPRGWSLSRDGRLLAGQEDDAAGPLGRLAQIRGRAAAALADDAWLRSKPNLPGSARGPWTRKREDWQHRYADDHLERINWLDPTGDEAAGITEEDQRRDDEAAARATAKLAAVIEQLPPRRGAVISGLRDAVLTRDEVAADLGIKVESVRTALSKTKSQLSAEGTLGSHTK